MGLEFLTPSGFIHRVTGRERSAPWSRDRLVWRILPHVTEVAARLGINPETASPRDLFAVAGVIADRFDQYGHFRPELIRAWHEGNSGIPAGKRGEWRSHEDWQRKLWQVIARGIDSPHPALTLTEFAANQKARDRASDDIPHLTVIGSGTIDTLLVEVLSMFSTTESRVGIHILLPTQHYLGELKAGALAALRMRRDPEEEIPATGDMHPLLLTMGRHAVGTFQLLGEVDEGYAGWTPQEGTNRREAATLLEKLQEDIRGMRAPAPFPLPEGDRTISVHACHGARREMEVIRDEILRAFREIRDLKPDEIHVVVPSLDDYAPLAQAILGDEALRVRLTEKVGPVGDPAISGLLALLALSVTERLSASGLLSLLHLEPVRDHLGIKDEGDLEKIRSWVRLSGLTADELSPEGAQPATGSMDFALHRLVAGHLLGELPSSRYPDRRFILPVAEQLGGEADLLMRFLCWTDTLTSTMGDWKSSASCKVWSVRLRNALREILGCTDGEDLNLLPHLHLLGELASDPDPIETPVDAGTILDWLHGTCGEELRRSQCSGQIAFGQFVHLQHLPCRVLIVAGMQDAAFPSRHRAASWDLLQASPKPWDRNPRVNDRQMFLDALLTPSDRLIITAPNQNVRTNDGEPFSTCVDELLRVLGSMGISTEKLVYHHRLQPFAKEYFEPGSPLPGSFSRLDGEVAKSIIQVESDGIRHKHPFWSGTAPALDPAETRLEITLKELTDFWKDPARGFVKAQGVLLPRDEEEDARLDRDPLTLDNLQDWNIKDTILRELALGNGEGDLLQARLQADRLLPLGALGDKIWKENLESVRHIVDVLRQEGIQRRRVSLRAPSDPNGLLPQGVELVITGEVLVTGDGGHLVDFRAGKLLQKGKARPKHHIASYVTAVFAAHDPATPLNLPSKLFGLDCPAPRILRALAGADLDDLRVEVDWRGITGQLLRGFLEGRLKPLCYAPETSNTVVELMKPKVTQNGVSPGLSFSDALPKAREKAWDPEASKYRSEGEGQTPAARMAWRDTDPFVGREPEWEDWTVNVASRVNEWANAPLNP